MKRILILALTALVAASSFAMTEPTFSGDFELSTQIDFGAKEYIVKASPDAEINLNGAVDDWSTVNAEINTTTVHAFDNDLDQGTVDGDKNGDDKKTIENVWYVNNFTLTTDITGALGFDGPVGVSIEWGKLTFEAEEYFDIAGYGEIEIALETGSYFGAEFIVTLFDHIKVLAAIVPQSYLSDAWGGQASGLNYPVMGFEVQLNSMMMGVEGIDANVWYTYDLNKFKGSQVGATVGYATTNFDLGFAGSFIIMEDRNVNDILSLAFAGKYKLDMFEFGLAFGMEDLTNDFVGKSSIGLNATFKAVPDVLDIFAAFDIPFTSFDTELGIEGGAVVYVGGTEYHLGYEYNTVNFKSPDNDGKDGLFFLVKASF
ncbi:MAG: hypothetical protein MI717_01915 [Spirochaetales bacterium]|nr:hypothetical protein [Spirochaetales bacterium]